LHTSKLLFALASALNSAAGRNLWQAAEVFQPPTQQALALFLRHNFGPPPLQPSQLRHTGSAGITAGGIIMANLEVHDVAPCFLLVSGHVACSPWCQLGITMGPGCRSASFLVYAHVQHFTACAGRLYMACDAVHGL
jgi:hypothetical protein